MRPPLLRHPLDGWADPAEVFAALFAHTDATVWLDSGSDATSGRSYLAVGASSIDSRQIAGSIFDFLATELADRADDDDDDAEGGFALGWVGWLGFELRFETLHQERVRESAFADAALIFVDRAIEFDHARQTVCLLTRGSDAIELAAWRQRMTDEILRAAPVVEHRPPKTTAVWRYSDEEYLDMIEQCQKAIASGDAYQLCLTNEVTVEGDFDAAQRYLALRSSSPSHHGFFFRHGPVALLSASPETFLTVDPSGLVESRPIKGTRRRGATVEEDTALAAELVASDKERAENLMIADLMRNDIGKVSALGTVSVPRLLEVESYAHVHQLVSTVQGQLAPGRGPMDAVLSCFPAGSMTGAPKLRATELLDNFEQRPRGIYSGAFGYFGLDGRVDLAMVIRTIVITPGSATVGAGGGITASSDPIAELAEVRLKAAPLLTVLGALPL